MKETPTLGVIMFFVTFVVVILAGYIILREMAFGADLEFKTVSLTIHSDHFGDGSDGVIPYTDSRFNMLNNTILDNIQISKQGFKLVDCGNGQDETYYCFERRLK